MPPSPSAPRFLDGKNDSAAARPIVPTCRPQRLLSPQAPTACAASSMIGTCAAAHTCSSIVVRATRPNRCTVSTALVRGPTRSAARVSSRVSVCSSTSANTGTAPRRAMAPAEAKNENGVVTTSSPRRMSSAISSASSASVPDDRATACSAPSVEARTAPTGPHARSPPPARPETAGGGQRDPGRGSLVLKQTRASSRQGKDPS